MKLSLLKERDDRRNVGQGGLWDIDGGKWAPVNRMLDQA